VVEKAKFPAGKSVATQSIFPGTFPQSKSTIAFFRNGALYPVTFSGVPVLTGIRHELKIP